MHLERARCQAATMAVPSSIRPSAAALLCICLFTETTLKPSIAPDLDDLLEPSQGVVRGEASNPQLKTQPVRKRVSRSTGPRIQSVRHNKAEHLPKPKDISLRSSGKPSRSKGFSKYPELWS